MEWMNEKNDVLRLERQLCFPLYVCSKEIIRKYKPYLDELNLTYTQYITLLVLWEHQEMSVRELGERLYLDSGTLTPLLKKLEQKGIITRNRLSSDERFLNVQLTKEGTLLKEQASAIPSQIGSCVSLTKEEQTQLYEILYKVLRGFQ